MVGSSNSKAFPDRNSQRASSSVENATSARKAKISSVKPPSPSQISRKTAATSSPKRTPKSTAKPKPRPSAKANRGRTTRRAPANSSDSTLNLSPNVRRWLTATLAVTLTGYSVQEILHRVEPETPSPDDGAQRESTQEDVAEIESNIAAPEASVGSAKPIAKPSWLQLSDRAREEILPKLQQHVRDRIQAHIELNAFNAMQDAYTQAEQRNFATALALLAQIPEGTSVYSQAQTKTAEYTQYQNTQASSWLRQAEALAKIEDFSRAQVYLGQIPEGTSVYATAQTKLAEYAEKQNTQANSWIEQASKLASAGNFSGAIDTLDLVPLGTPAYTTAKAKIIEYRQQQQRFQAVRPAESDVNS